MQISSKTSAKQSLYYEIKKKKIELEARIQMKSKKRDELREVKFLSLSNPKDAQYLIEKGEPSVARVKIAESVTLEKEIKILEIDLKRLTQMASELDINKNSIGPLMAQYNNNIDQIIEEMMKQKETQEEIARKKYILDRAREDAQIEDPEFEAEISRVQREMEMIAIRKT